MDARLLGRAGCTVPTPSRSLIQHSKALSSHQRCSIRFKGHTVITLARSNNAPQQASVTVTTPQPTPLTTPLSPSSLWLQVFLVLGLTVSTVSAATTAVILYIRPAFRAAHDAAKSADIAAKDMQIAAKEMEKTALMFQQDLPLTMQDVQRASEEWELVGKQMNFIVGTVSRPLSSVERPVERAAEWATGVAENTTATLSKRVASDTSSLANSLWASISQFRRQLGWTGLSSEAAEEAKRLVNAGRQKQEVRSWIAHWRGRSRRAGAAKAASDSAAAAQRESDKREAAEVQRLEAAEVQRLEAAANRMREEMTNAPVEQQSAVEAVFAALDRAQRAAEEAAASSSALELAIEQAESTGVLSSSDEDDEIGSTEKGKSGMEKEKKGGKRADVKQQEGNGSSAMWFVGESGGQD